MWKLLSIKDYPRVFIYALVFVLYAQKMKMTHSFLAKCILGVLEKNPNILVNRQWTLESKKNPQASSLEQRVPRTMNLCMKTTGNSVISPIPVHSGVTSEATCISYLLSSVWANKSLKKITCVEYLKNKQYHVHCTCETNVQYLAKSHTGMQGFTHWLNPVLTWATVQCHCHILQVFTSWCKKKSVNLSGYNVKLSLQHQTSVHVALKTTYSVKLHTVIDNKL